MNLKFKSKIEIEKENCCEEIVVKIYYHEINHTTCSASMKSKESVQLKNNKNCVILFSNG